LLWKFNTQLKLSQIPLKKKSFKAAKKVIGTEKERIADNGFWNGLRVNCCCSYLPLRKEKIYFGLEDLWGDAKITKINYKVSKL